MAPPLFRRPPLFAPSLLRGLGLGLTMVLALSLPSAPSHADATDTAIPIKVKDVAQALPSLGADLSTLTISGLSSGAYMTVQMETAYSSQVKGAAVFAGGPFGCARGDTTIATIAEAMTHCVSVPGTPLVYQGPPSVEPRIKDTRRMADEGSIDPVSGLQDDHVYLFSGKADHTVPQGVMKALKSWYHAFVPDQQVSSDFDVDAGHAMITTDWKNACAKTELPFINNCHMDGAYTALHTLYGSLKTNSGAQGGTMYTITQSAYVPKHDMPYTGLHEYAHLFVPDSCSPDHGSSGCRLHVVFHGCKQNQDFINDQYYMKTGYNKWAAANRIILLYPQTKASQVTLYDPLGMPNPDGCWDWWGYTAQNYLTKDGIQMKTVWTMIERLAQKP